MRLSAFVLPLAVLDRTVLAVLLSLALYIIYVLLPLLPA
jgi:hypothetical protein